MTRSKCNSNVFHFAVFPVEDEAMNIHFNMFVLLILLPSINLEYGAYETIDEV